VDEGPCQFPPSPLDPSAVPVLLELLPMPLKQLYPYKSRHSGLLFEIDWR
jgi:hypothetical protein